MHSIFRRGFPAMVLLAAIFVAGITPSGMEFFEKEAAFKTFEYCDKVLNSPVTTKLTEGMNAYLLCELDGNDEEVLMRDAERGGNLALLPAARQVILDAAYASIHRIRLLRDLRGRGTRRLAPVIQ